MEREIKFRTGSLEKDRKSKKDRPAKKEEEGAKTGERRGPTGRRTQGLEKGTFHSTEFVRDHRDLGTGID